MYDPDAGPGGASQGFLLSNDQFNDLMRAFPGPSRDGHEIDIRKELDWLRELILKEDRGLAQQPSRAQIHAGLARFAFLVCEFLNCAQRVDFDWLAENPPIEPAGPMSLAYSFPSRLRALAGSARQAGNAELIMLADAADHLAQYLTLLNEPAQHRIFQDKTFRDLTNPCHYEVREFADAVRIAQQLEGATRSALESSKKRGGPLPRPMLLYAVISLGELIERYGGTFTHSPYLGLEYKGTPQTAAGQFVLNFLQSCVPSITAQNVCSLMAAAIERRNRTRDRKSGIRSTSF
ncbi:hypothetical protein [Bradyrhizobium sp. 141]|uniref:hypothetical protein n=1 Tax=Bradyrhizobium sp. 141 TaxID=2782617 RepID=UPI001FF70040|nr:hypothetical protein [Bradyrhizobium sp. 141]MCK1718710.1 hypothetical protein [Bradyrhizobium sp. 141]